MNDPMIIAAAAVLVIGAMAAAIVSVLSAFGKMKSELLAQMADVAVKAQKIADATSVNAAASMITSKKVDHLAVQTGALQTVTDKVHDSTNSNYSELKKELAESRLEVKEGHQQIAKSQATIEELVAAVLGREQANGEGIHTIAESLAQKTDKEKP